MTRDEELLAYLRRKNTAVGFGRICDDFRWQGPEVEAVLSKLLRHRLITAPGPRQYQAVTETFERTPAPDREATSAPPIAESVDRDRLLGATGDVPVPAPPPEPQQNNQAPATAAAVNDEGTTMPLKKCEKCSQRKGPRAFEKGDQTCRECRGSNKAARKAGPPPAARKRSNGSTSDVIAAAIEELKARREARAAEHAAELGKLDTAIEQLQAVA
jgi:hypothetical protein